MYTFFLPPYEISLLCHCFLFSYSIPLSLCLILSLCPSVLFYLSVSLSYSIPLSLCPSVVSYLSLPLTHSFFLARCNFNNLFHFFNPFNWFFMCSPTSLIIFYSFSTFISTSISTSSLVLAISRAWSENEPLRPFYRCRPIVKKQKWYSYIRRKRNTRIRMFIFEENFVKFSFYSFEHRLRSDKSL